MPEHHPDRDTLERFSRGELCAPEGRRIEEHLRSGCAVCQRKVDDLLWWLEAEGSTAEGGRDDADWNGDWKGILARLEQRLTLVALERGAAPRLLEELLRASAAQREELIRTRRRYQTLALCERLIEASLEAGFREPAQAVALAQLAIQVADRLDGDYYGPSVVQDLRARTWAYLGNARRVASDLAGAERDFARAEELARGGSADPMEEARILDLRASLLSDQGRFERAAELLEVVIDIYDDVQDGHRKGRALISQGLIQGYAGRPEEGVEGIARGLALVDWEREPRLVLMARHNLAWCLNDCGRSAEALQQLERFRHAYHDFPDAWTGLRLVWLEARIAAGLGRRDEAEEKLLDLRRQFVEREIGYEASQVTLDLALLYLEQGRREEVQQLAREMLPLFLSQDLHREAMAALIAFQQAAEIGRATPVLVRRIAGYLVRARNNPGLRFEA